METNKCELKGCSNPVKNIFENKKTKGLYTTNKSFPVCIKCINKVKNKTNKCFTKVCKDAPIVNFKRLDMCELCLDIYLWKNYCIVDIKCESINCEKTTNVYKHIDDVLAEMEI